MAHYDVEPLEGFHPEIGLLLASLYDSTREWRENLEGVTSETIKFQLVPEGPSIGALLLHMIETEAYWIETFIAGKAPNPEEDLLYKVKETDVDNHKFPVAYEQPIEWYFELHDQLRLRCLESLKGVEPTEVRTSPNHEFTVRWILAHLVEHDAYHGGQLVLLNETAKRLLTASV